jgi:excinuclease ABC subunit C
MEFLIIGRRESMSDFNKELKNLPEKSGVYIMRDKNNNIIYIGKAKALNKRVKQYFTHNKSHSLKTRSMLANLSSFEYIVTDSELEALILECNLIKKYKPRYNILLKDDKNYPYIKVTLNEEYPRIFMTRKIQDDGAKYFGPYSSSVAVREAIDTVKKVFAIRTCKKDLSKGKESKRPCLNYYIDQCLGPCSGTVSAEEYRELFKDVCSFLSGKNKEILKRFEEEMLKASLNMDFERAARIRDKIEAIKSISERQKIISSPNDEQDIIAFAQEENISCVQVFFIREGKLTGREHFIIKNVEGMRFNELIETFIKQFYNRGVYIPREIMLQEDIEEKDVIEEWLSSQKGLKVHIRVPQKGRKKKLVELVNKNAQETLQQLLIRSKAEGKNAQEVLKAIKELLSLKDIPQRIEAYDISNISGFSSVGSMVVFNNGVKSGKDYRRFKIKSVQGINDYESLKEVLYRRFRRASDEVSSKEFGELPDLVFVDGGKGHVSGALDVLKELGVSIPIFGLVKDDKHRTRGITTEKEEYTVPMGSSLFKFITQVQDEAHRYAIEYHRKLRSKKTITSELELIKGIGEQRRKNLLKYFKSIDNIKRAEVDELIKVKGMNRSVAEQVYNYFHFK